MKFLPSLLSFFSIYLLVPSTNNTYCEVAQQTRIARMIQKNFCQFLFLSRFLLFSICSSSKCMFVNLLKDFVQMLLTFTHEMSADNSQAPAERITEIRRRCSPLFFTKATLYEVLSSHYHLGFPARHFQPENYLLTQTLE